MTKSEFLEELQRRISGLPPAEVEDRLSFYSEMIDDLTEEGLREDEAIEKIGSPESIANQIIAETPLREIVKESVKPKRSLALWEIILLVLGCPLWLSLLLCAAATVFSVYITIWSVMICLWAVFVSLVFTAPALIAAGIILAVKGNVLSGFAVISGGLVIIGVLIFAYLGCLAFTKAIILLTKKISLGIKNRFIKKEAK